MKLITLMCPNCKSPLDIDSDIERKVVYCQYCGAPVYLDDGSVNINAKIDHTIRRVDAAKVEKQKSRQAFISYLREESERAQRNRKWAIPLLLGITVFLWIALAFMYSREERVRLSSDLFAL